MLKNLVGRFGAAIVVGGCVWSTPAWPQAVTPDSVIATSDWKEFLRVVNENYAGEADVSHLEDRCRQAVAANTSASDETTVEACLRAATDSLAYLSLFFSIAETAELDAQARRQFVGIGLEMTQDGGMVRIVTPIQGSPADRAGLKAGDFIVSANDKLLRGLPLAEAVRVMRGEAGTDLRLAIARPGHSGPIVFVVRRDHIRVQTVRAKWLSPEHAYIRISQFRDETHNQLVEAVQMLQSSGRSELPWLVLDLRGNTGGLMQAAVDVSSLFVAHGLPLVNTVGRKAGATQTWTASSRPERERKVELIHEPTSWPLRRGRVGVMVDGRTGGGAEALAALLKQSRAATVLGETSSGFGLVQELIRLQSGASIRLATAKMLSPGGNTWHGRGIPPAMDLGPADPGTTWEYGELGHDLQLKRAIAVLGSGTGVVSVQER